MKTPVREINQRMAKKPATKKAATKKVAKKPAVKKPAVGGAVVPNATVKEAKVIQREVIYEDIEVRVYRGETALNEQDAKNLLLWEEEREGVKFGANYLLTDNDGKKIRCYNNISNRPFYTQIARTWESEVLNKRWRLNGETMIIGKTGINISCQHRLIGFILACQEWRKNREKWAMWDEEPTMDCIVVFGVEETDDVINTVDTGKIRTLTDVIFRSELIRDYKEADRKTLANIISFAIKTVADRTGAWVNAFGPKRTHSEMLNFLDRHSKLLEACKHIFEELSPEATCFVTPGTAAGLLYLMGASTTDPAAYVLRDTPTESSLDMGNWEKACDFWVQVIHRKFPALVARMGQFTQDSQADGETETSGGTRAELIAVIVKAWRQFIAGKKVTEDDLKLSYHVEDGIKILTECPTVGGVDQGNPKDAADVAPPTPEEIQERKQEENKKAQEEKSKPVKKAVKKVAGKSDKVKEGSTAYHVIDEENGIWWGGVVTEIFPVGGGKNKARVSLTIPKNMKDKIEEVDYDQLSLTKPN